MEYARWRRDKNKTSRNKQIGWAEIKWNHTAYLLWLLVECILHLGCWRYTCVYTWTFSSFICFISNFEIRQLCISFFRSIVLSSTFVKSINVCGNVFRTSWITLEYILYWNGCVLCEKWRRHAMKVSVNARLAISLTFDVVPYAEWAFDVWNNLI